MSTTNNNHTQRPEQTECNNMTYDNLDKTANFPVTVGFVSFTHTFLYLGSLINYSLCDDNVITARIASATAAMGALKEI
jgi:hypothetical protein